MHTLPLEPDPRELEEITRAVAAFVLEEILALASRPASDLGGGGGGGRPASRGPRPETGRPLEAILERLRPAIAKGYTTSGPGYLAFIPRGGGYSPAPPDLAARAGNRS